MRPAIAATPDLRVSRAASVLRMAIPASLKMGRAFEVGETFLRSVARGLVQSTFQDYAAGNPIAVPSATSHTVRRARRLGPATPPSDCARERQAVRRDPRRNPPGWAAVSARRRARPLRPPWRTAGRQVVSLSGLSRDRSLYSREEPRARPRTPNSEASSRSIPDGKVLLRYLPLEQLERTPCTSDRSPGTTGTRNWQRVVAAASAITWLLADVKFRGLSNAARYS